MHTYRCCAAGFGPDAAAPLLADFAARWRVALEAMTTEVGAQLAEQGVAREVLQVCAYTAQHTA
jgi:hypothetical protein